MLPFYPAGWPLGLTIATAAIGLACAACRARGRLRGHRLPALRTSRSGSRSSSRRSRRPGSRSTLERPARQRSPLSPGPLLGPLVGARAAAPRRAVRARSGPARRPGGAGVLLAASSPGSRHDRLPFDGTLAAARARHRRRARAPAPSARAPARPRGPPRRARGGRRHRCAAVALPYLRGRGPWVAALAGGGAARRRARSAPRRRFVPLVAAALVTAGFVLLAPRRAGAGRRGRERRDERLVGPGEEQVLPVAQARDGADLRARGVVDADLGTDVALGVDVDPRRRSRARASSAASARRASWKPSSLDRDEQPGRAQRRRAAPRARPAPPASSCSGSAARGSRPACWRPRSSPGASQRTSVSQTW